MVMHSSLPRGASQFAYIVFLCGALIALKSKELDRVTKNPLASNVMPLFDSADACHFVSKMEAFFFSTSCIAIYMLHSQSIFVL